MLPAERTSTMALPPLALKRQKSGRVVCPSWFIIQQAYYPSKSIEFPTQPNSGHTRSVLGQNAKRLRY